jgi:hypothetical protein
MAAYGAYSDGSVPSTACPRVQAREIVVKARGKGEERRKKRMFLLESDAQQADGDMRFWNRQMTKRYESRKRIGTSAGPAYS